MQDDMKQTETEENIAKYSIKDSVFSDLFKMKKISVTAIQGTSPRGRDSDRG